MSSSDLYVDGFPHGTPEGYDRDCRGGACPAGVAYGLSCKIAKQKSRGDFQYQKLVKAGASVPEIAAALGLVGAETLPAPAKKTEKVTPAPTPMTALGGVSITDAAAAASKAAAVAKVAVSDVTTPTAAAPVDEAVDDTPTVEPEPEPEAQAEKVEADDTTERPPAPTAGEIRAWARARGYEVGAKGKLPQYIVDHYWETTGRLAPAAETADWGSVAESVDVEDARRWAVRFEQAYARSEELHAETAAELEKAQAEAMSIVTDYLDQVDKTIKHEAHIEDLRERLATEKKLREVAERAATLALSKWGAERADNEACHALIIGQAHTINSLSAALEGPRWVLGADIDTSTLDAGPGRIMHVPTETHYYYSSTDTPDGTIDADADIHRRPNTTDGTPPLEPIAVSAVNAELQRGAEVVKERPWWRR